MKEFVKHPWDPVQLCAIYFTSLIMTKTEKVFRIIIFTMWSSDHKMAFAYPYTESVIIHTMKFYVWFRKLRRLSINLMSVIWSKFY